MSHPDPLRRSGEAGVDALDIHAPAPGTVPSNADIAALACRTAERMLALRLSLIHI